MFCNKEVILKPLKKIRSVRNYTLELSVTFMGKKHMNYILFDQAKRLLCIQVMYFVLRKNAVLPVKSVAFASKPEYTRDSVKVFKKGKTFALLLLTSFLFLWIVNH